MDALLKEIFEKLNDKDIAFIAAKIIQYIIDGDITLAKQETKKIIKALNLSEIKIKISQ